MKTLNKLLLIALVSVFSSSTSNAQCQARFTHVNTGNGNVTFTNTSTGSYSYAHWNFDDGGGAIYNTSVTVPHSYYLDGTYYVCLVVGDSITGCYSTYCDSISIFGISNCNAQFIFNNNGNNVVSFSNTSIGNYTSVLWDFDDATTSGLYSPTHTFPSTGIYNVCLTVNDSNSGCSNTYCDSVVLTGPANCNALFAYNNNGNGSVSFTNTSTGNYTFWTWNFGDGNQSWLTNSPLHTYNYNGVYNVCLFVADSSSGCYNTYCDSIQITNYPSCNASFYYYPDSSNTYDVIVVNNSIGNNLSYLWDFGDGVTSSQQYPQHTYASLGNYYLCLTVNNGNGCVNMFCDSINASGVHKQQGFSINIVSPTATGINEDNVKLISKIKTYPNPFKDNVTIELNLTTTTQVDVFINDLLGNTIDVISTKNLNIGNNKLQWNASKFSNGIYLLNVKTNNSLQVKKLILNR